MKLLIDLGNTRLKWAVAKDDKLIQRGNFDNCSLSASLMEDEFAKIESSAAITSAYLSCVAGKKLAAYVAEAVQVSFGVELQVAKTSHPIVNFSNAYETIDTLGIDRWLAAVGARSLRQQGSLVVVDAGTAVTIEYLDQDNVYQGGVIMPGLTLMHESLTTKTANIKSDLMGSDQIIGKTTNKCVNSGVIYGLVGGIERVVQEMIQSVNCECHVIITGGASDKILEKLRIGAEYHADLVLFGLLEYSQNY